MNILFSIFAFVIAISALIIIHELGHFWVARVFQVKVLRFAFGFGPPIWKHVSKKHQTEFVIAPLLLGGYVKFLDSREATVAPADTKYTFDHQSSWRRFLIILAGPLTNFLFAFCAFSLMFAIGIKFPKPIIAQVLPHSIASTAQVPAQSTIIGIDGKGVQNWQDIVINMMRRYGEAGAITLQLQTSPLQRPESYRLDLTKWHSNSFRPDPLQDFGMVPYHPLAPPIIGDLDPKGPAAKAGLLKGDVVLRVDSLKIQNWEQMTDFVKTKPHQKIIVEVSRTTAIDGSGSAMPQPNSQQKSNLHMQSRQVRHKFVVQLGSRYGSDWRRIGYIGLKSTKVGWPVEMIQLQQYSWWYAPVPALRQVIQFTDFNLAILTKLLTGKISLHVLGGPLSVFQTTAQALQRGPIVYLGILALISLTLGFANLLPIPGLDGGHMVITIIEGVRRKMLANAALILLMRIGMVFLLVLILQATFNDIVRILM